jgi:eukaryotic-like serine/threonine-protein kinase
MEGERKATAFLQGPGNEGFGVFSPGADWIAYSSDESGQSEIYVQHFPANGSKFQISSGGGIDPRWSRDDKELFYRGRARNLVSVPVTADATFARGQARTLFENVPFAGTFQPSADGRRFLAVVTEGEPQAPPVVVITNWQTTLKK